jgi:hypothetical protein
LSADWYKRKGGNGVQKAAHGDGLHKTKSIRALALPFHEWTFEDARTQHMNVKRLLHDHYFTWLGIRSSTDN